MRALTLTQPWATLVAIGAKKIETRSWNTPHRGQLLIHAAKGYTGLSGPAGFIGCCANEPFRSVLRQAGLSHRDIPRSVIIAVCDLIDVRIIGVETNGDPTVLADDMLSFTPILGNEHAFGNYAAGRYAWLLGNVRTLPEPVPCKGALGLWTPDAATIARVREQVER